MSNPPFNLKVLDALERDFDRALDVTRDLAHKWVALQNLTHMDPMDSPEISPYLPEAINEFEKAYKIDEQDGDAIHHLAIAYHARAWDNEFSDPYKASEYWEKALNYWEILRKNRPFWEALAKKGTALAKNFELDVLETFRQNLMEPLLETHADFVLYYINRQKSSSARRHVQVVQKASIPPASRQDFAKLVYKKLSLPLDRYEQKADFDNALKILDQFLELFPRYIPALERYLTVSRRCLVERSPYNSAQPILELDQRTIRHWSRLKKILADQPDLAAQHAAASTIIMDCACHFADEYFRYSNTVDGTTTPQDFPLHVSLKNDVWEVYARVIEWLITLELSQAAYIDNQDLLIAAFGRQVRRMVIGHNNNHPDVVNNRAAIDEKLQTCTALKDVVEDHETLDHCYVQLLRMRVMLFKKSFEESQDRQFLKYALTDCEAILDYDPAAKDIQSMRDSILKWLQANS